MNRNYLPEAIILAVVCILLFAISCMALSQRDEYKRERDLLRKEAIDRGCAQYNPTNAIWQWKSNTNH